MVLHHALYRFPLPRALSRNLEVADRFGQYFARIPIKASPHIVCANALTTDWPQTDFIMGNPPFLGAHSPGMD